MCLLLPFVVTFFSGVVITSSFCCGNKMVHVLMGHINGCGCYKLVFFFFSSWSLSQRLPKMRPRPRKWKMCSRHCGTTTNGMTDGFVRIDLDEDELPILEPVEGSTEDKAISFDISLSQPVLHIQNIFTSL